MKAYQSRMDHWGCIEWIESHEFKNLTDEDRRTNEERRRTSMESLTKMSRKRYGSTPTWIFSLLSLFLTNFKWKLSAKIARLFKLNLFPLFIGEKGRWLPPSSPKRARLLPPEATFSPESFGWAQMGPVAIYTLHFAKYTPIFMFLVDFFP